LFFYFFFFSSRRRHTRFSRDWSSDVCSSDLERDLLEYAEARVRELPGITLVGTAAQRAGVLSFLIDGTHPHDVGMLLDQQGVARSEERRVGKEGRTRWARCR